jgi:hypothetical protein
MVQGFLALIINLLVVDPLQEELNKRLAQARAPQAIIADVRACAEGSLPELAQRAMAEPVWVMTTVFDVWTGRAAPEDVLSTSAQCESTIKTARTYLESRGA